MKLLVLIALVLTCSLLAHSQQSDSPQKDNNSREERLKEIQRRRKQLQQKYAQELGQINQEQADNYQMDGQISLTQQTKSKESETYTQMLNQHTEQLQHNVQFLFETQRMDQFVIKSSQQQLAMLQIRLYVIYDNAYTEIQNVQKQAPLRISIYEDNTRLVAQQQYYFLGAIVFNCRKGSTYTVRFVNSGLQKLVSVHQNMIIESQHTEGLLKEEHAKQYSMKAKSIQGRFEEIFADMQRMNAMTMVNGAKFVQKTYYFFCYQMVELIICVGVCFAQVTFIKNLLRSGSIV